MFSRTTIPALSLAAVLGLTGCGAVVEAATTTPRPAPPATQTLLPATAPAATLVNVGKNTAQGRLHAREGVMCPNVYDSYIVDSTGRFWRLTTATAGSCYRLEKKKYGVLKVSIRTGPDDPVRLVLNTTSGELIGSWGLPRPDELPG